MTATMEPVSAGEIARRLEDLSTVIRGDLQEIKGRMDSYVLQAVYQAESRAFQTQLHDLRALVESEGAARRTQVRWVWGSVVIPVTLAAVALVSALIVK